MQEDFHYYATYCAAYLAGYSHQESMAICYSAQFVDLCTRTFLESVGGPSSAATTQLQLEMVDARTDTAGLADITRIWSSFHFLPKDLYAEVRGGKRYQNKYRLICGPNGSLVADTVKLAKDRGEEAVGVAMHVLADTWAHQHFAGTPSLVINNTGYHFYEILGTGEKTAERHIQFRHNPAAPDDLKAGKYTNTIYQSSEKNIMNLGHGRAGHLPDYSFIRYRYMPAWGEYREVIKDNPSDYMQAFCQMVYAMRYLRGDYPDFELDTYDRETVAPHADRINQILTVRRLDACADWKAFGEELSGQVIDDFDLKLYQKEYLGADKEKKDETFLGRFFLAALRHKSMVTNRIYTSGNNLAGISIDYKAGGFQGIEDFAGLVDAATESTIRDTADELLQRTEKEGEDK